MKNLFNILASAAVLILLILVGVFIGQNWPTGGVAASQLDGAKAPAVVYSTAAVPPAPAQQAPRYNTPAKQPASSKYDGGAVVACIPDQTMYDETGLPRAIETNAPGDYEFCKWNFQLPTPYTIYLPPDGLLTAKMADGKHVLWVGQGQSSVVVPNVLEGTLRLGRGYPADAWVHMGSEAFVGHEIGYADNLRSRTGGRDNIQYMTGNFVDSRLPRYNSGGSVPQPAATAVPAPTAAPQSQCDNVPNLIGGTGTWSRSGDDPKIWVYTGNGSWQQGKKLKYPGFGYFDYWNMPNQKVTIDLPDDNTSFHCNAPN